MLTLPETDLVVHELCLGGNVFGWGADEKGSFEVLDAYKATVATSSTQQMSIASGSLEIRAVSQRPLSASGSRAKTVAPL
jgi:hypothetical protein